MTDVEPSELRKLYLDLLERALMHTLYRPIDDTPLPDHVVAALADSIREMIARGEAAAPDWLQMRLDGLDQPLYGQTMVGAKRLENVRSCVERVIGDGVPGDLLEAGVWRGGVGIYMRGILRAHGVADRQVVLADSFQGLPTPNVELYPSDADFSAEEVGRFSVGLAEVRANFAHYDLLDDQVEFVEGWFSESLPTLDGRRWSVLRLDGDLYESTMDCLVNLYDGLAPGGFLIIDDYVLEPCRQAVHDFRSDRGIEEPIETIDWASAFWRRSR